MRRLVLFCAVTLASVLAAGCSAFQVGQMTFGKRAAISFQNRLTMLPTAPDNRLDPTTANGVDYHHIRVLDANGKQVVLSVSQGPILFAAYWCPHCQRTLVLFSKKSQELQAKPVVVCVGYPAGTTLKQAVHVETEEVSELHLATFTTYYDLSPQAGDIYAPKGYPTLAYQALGQTKLLFGEHTWSIWKQVL